MTKETYEDGATVTYQYDNNGALATVTDSETGIKTTYCYDLTGRLIKQVESGDGHNFSIEYTMDAQNRVTKYYSIANGDERANFYTYDDDNRITAYQKSADIRHYVYDEFGRVQSERQAYKTSTVVTTQYSFTGTSAQVAAVRNTASGLDRTLSYTYDDNGNILTISDGTNTTSYVYDSANQLIRENNQAGNYTYIWTYDNAGNILSRTEYAYTTGSLEGVTPIDTVTYTYGNSQWGDLLTGYDGRTFSYDAIGNLTNDGI